MLNYLNRKPFADEVFSIKEIKLLLQIVIQNNKINYEELNKYSNEIINGTIYINRLLLAEESGRIAGGERNVDASIILATNEAANPTKQNEFKRTEHEKLLKDYADNKKIWFDESQFQENDIITQGAEAKVYPSPKEGYVRKVINYRRYSNTPLEFLDNRVSLHNYLFPDTAYTLAGFTNTEDFTGNKQFAFVVEQPFVQGRYINFDKDLEAFKSELEKGGFTFKVENFRPLLVGKDYIVEDLHQENILVTKQGNFRFIDTVPSLNTKKSKYQGTRLYGDGELISIINSTDR